MRLAKARLKPLEFCPQGFKCCSVAVQKYNEAKNDIFSVDLDDIFIPLNPECSNCGFKPEPAKVCMIPFEHSAIYIDAIDIAEGEV